jgi:hypothetical protein
MFEFVATFIVLMLAILAMSFSFIVSGRRFKRSCGGIANLKRLIGFTPCEACKQKSADCPLRPPLLSD